MKILVIDDEKPTLSMFRLFLTAYGYEVHTAESGEAGLEAFASLKPDMVFTDIRMPGMGGLEVLRRIRQADPRCQVIIITGHGDMEKAVDALDMDASDFINKPVERQALNSALIRAESRLARSGKVSFSLKVSPDPQGVLIRIKGRLGRDSRPALESATRTVGQGPVTFRFEKDFSIDRHGIALLMEILKALAEKGGQIRMTGLSYNYIRFFEMAGIHKMADIAPAEAEEPGL